jgi:hypothetical protein
MTIRYSNGYTVDAILLAREGNSMRVAIREFDETVEFFEINGVWVSQNCEPVEVEFAWMRQTDMPVLTETDCLCSHELAARLVHLLWSGENEPAVSLVSRAAAASAGGPIS